VSYKLSIRRRAADDLVAVRGWYDEQATGLGNKFLGRVKQVFERIEKGPLRFPLAAGDVRKATVVGFPYNVFFRMRGNSIRVIAVFHQSRDPDMVARRLEK
jgi:toxin ParE1/3/4